MSKISLVISLYPPRISKSQEVRKRQCPTSQRTDILGTSNIRDKKRPKTGLNYLCGWAETLKELIPLPLRKESRPVCRENTPSTWQHAQWLHKHIHASQYPSGVGELLPCTSPQWETAAQKQWADHDHLPRGTGSSRLGGPSAYRVFPVLSADAAVAMGLSPPCDKCQHSSGTTSVLNKTTGSKDVKVEKKKQTWIPFPCWLPRI